MTLRRILRNGLLAKMLARARCSKTRKITEALGASNDRNAIYAEMSRFYATRLPAKFVQHRRFFCQEQRGFGEDAFHSMWYRIFSEFKPVDCLEIGVYRGQTLTLWQLLAQEFGYTARISGLSPFSSAGDTVSRYADSIDYLEDTKKNHREFNLAYPEFHVGYSNSDSAKSFISRKKWDLIYIDGSHDYDVVCQDWRISTSNLAAGGLIVMDDSSLYFDYSAGPGSFAGHPGPSRVAKEVARHELQLLGGVGHNNIFRKG